MQTFERKKLNHKQYRAKHANFCTNSPYTIFIKYRAHACKIDKNTGKAVTKV